MFFKDVDCLSGCVSSQRGWEYDEMLEPEFNRFWKNVDDVRLVSEISEWVSSPKVVGPRFALVSRDIDRGLFIERRLPERLIRLAQIIHHICVRFERTSTIGDLFLALQFVPIVEERRYEIFSRAFSGTASIPDQSNNSSAYIFDKGSLRIESSLTILLMDRFAYALDKRTERKLHNLFKVFSSLWNFSDPVIKCFGISRNLHGL